MRAGREVKFGIGATKAKDTDIRKVKVEKIETATRNPVSDETIDLPPDGNVLEVIGEDIHSALISVVDIDKSGNASTPSPVFEYAFIDDIPPAQPDGVVSVLSKEEI